MRDPEISKSRKAESPKNIISAPNKLKTAKPNIINFIVGLTSIFFSGIFFSIDSLPTHIGSISNGLPLTIGLDVIQKALLEGFFLNQILTELTQIFYLIIVFLPSGIFLVYHSLKIAKKNGSLNHY